MKKKAFNFHANFIKVPEKTYKLLLILPFLSNFILLLTNNGDCRNLYEMVLLGDWQRYAFALILFLLTGSPFSTFLVVNILMN